MQTAVLISTIFLTTFLLRWLKRVYLPLLPLPPGPTGYPIIGNLLDVPVHMPWKKYRQWCDEYGDIVYFKIFNKQTIVIGSAQATIDLLEKRSDIYSDRPPNVMHEMLTTTRWNFGNMRYSPEWRNHRREFHQFFHQRKVSVYQPIQLRECRAFLRRALHDPTHLAPKIRTIYAAIILKIVYDMEVTDVYHEFIKTAERVFLAISVAQIPGFFWVEFFPFLRYIPSWVPGTYFKKFAEEHIPMVRKMLDDPFEAVKRDMAIGKAGDTVVATLLERLRDESDKKENQPEKELFVRNVMGVAYGAASDTTATAAQAFFIAMSLFPDVQQKAQDEVDRVVGPNRLPEFDDYENLVYIKAIILETMRWMPVVALNVPHYATADNVYKGLHIPKGATILVNIWAILHDPEVYPEPERFNPDRFIKNGVLDQDVPNPLNIAFGNGRRICPGRWLSGASLFITIASVVHTFNIHPVFDANGKTFDPYNHEIEGIVTSIESIPCTVTPRSPKAEVLIRSSETPIQTLK